MQEGRRWLALSVNLLACETGVSRATWEETRSPALGLCALPSEFAVLFLDSQVVD
jgi:hypothetical protein